MPDEKKNPRWRDSVRQWLKSRPVPLWVWSFSSVIAAFAIGLIIYAICQKGIVGLEGINYIMLSLAAAVAAPFGVWRMTLTHRQTEINQQSVHTESYLKAIDYFNHPDLAIRTGAIYELGKIAKESEAHHLQIVELLCAYIRANATEAYSKKQGKQILRIDLQATLDVLGRRSETWIKIVEPKDFRLNLVDSRLNAANLHGLNFNKALFKKAHLKKADLSNAHLEDAQLQDAHLESADLSFAHLEGADLGNAHLEDARLSRAHLEGAKLLNAHLKGAILFLAHLKKADLSNAHLEGALLWDAHLEDARLIGAHLEGASLWDAHLEDTDLSYAHLEGADLWEVDLKNTKLQMTNLAKANLCSVKLLGVLNLTQEQVKSAFGDDGTTLPDNVKRPSHWPTKELGIREARVKWEKWKKTLKKPKRPK